jgi:hypothetical protein
VLELVSRLVCGDLGEVEDVEEVDPLAGELETRKTVRREVAEGMRGREAREDQCREHGEADHEPSHRRTFRATGA